MDNNIKRFLQFNGKNVYFTAKDGSWYVAIKPICEALGVQYEHQRILLKKDKTWAQLPCEHMVVAADGKVRKMVCLPEFFIYGWIFSIQSQSEDLAQYKMKCYELLYNYFHGTITKRNQFLMQKVQTETEIAEMEKQMSSNADFVKYKELKSKKYHTQKALNKLDKDLITNQLPIFKE
jgi:hypothetical protein